MLLFYHLLIAPPICVRNPSKSYIVLALNDFGAQVLSPHQNPHSHKKLNVWAKHDF